MILRNSNCVRLKLGADQNVIKIVRAVFLILNPFTQRNGFILWVNLTSFTEAFDTPHTAWYLINLDLIQLIDTTPPLLHHDQTFLTIDLSDDWHYLR